MSSERGSLWQSDGAYMLYGAVLAALVGGVLFCTLLANPDVTPHLERF